MTVKTAYGTIASIGDAYLKKISEALYLGGTAWSAATNYGNLMWAVRREPEAIVENNQFSSLITDPLNYLYVREKNSAAMATDLAALEVLITAGNVDLAALEVLLGAIDADTNSIKTAVEKIDDYEDPKVVDHQRIIPMNMSTDLLIVSTDAQVDVLTEPGEGHHLEVYGYQISVEKEAALATLAAAGFLSFVTSSQYLWIGSMTEGINCSESIAVSGIRVVGGNNEALSLSNFNWGTGNADVRAVVFYKDITD